MRWTRRVKPWYIAYIIYFTLKQAKENIMLFSNLVQRPLRFSDTRAFSFFLRTTQCKLNYTTEAKLQKTDCSDVIPLDNHKLLLGVHCVLITWEHSVRWNANWHYHENSSCKCQNTSNEQTLAQFVEPSPLKRIMQKRVWSNIGAFE